VGPAVQRDHGAHGARWPQGVEHHRAAGPAQHARSRNAPRRCAPPSLTPAHAQGEFETRDPALKTLNGLEIGNLVCKGAPAPCVLPRAPACRAAPPAPDGTLSTRGSGSGEQVGAPHHRQPATGWQGGRPQGAPGRHVQGLAVSVAGCRGGGSVARRCVGGSVSRALRAA
jgi:hypothetical protein